MNTLNQIKIKKYSSEICKIAKQNKIPLSITEPLSKKQQEFINTNYFELNLPCPLLGSDNSCLMYNNRPIVCWSFRNYGTPKDCYNSAIIKYGLPFVDLGRYVTLNLFKNISCNFSSYYLLPYAISKIL